MSTSDTNINMKSLGDKGISIINNGHLNLTIYNEGEKEEKSKRKRNSSEKAKDHTPDIEGETRAKGKKIK